MKLFNIWLGRVFYAYRIVQIVVRESLDLIRLDSVGGEVRNTDFILREVRKP